ncbi:MAG: DUF523 domain-containing protein [Deltaproteobacteria bacterium]|nr:DUF523 domain-containing protein [Deltaproteobacteria bacterium]
MKEKNKIGISACLLGEKVRYDGGHLLDRFRADTLGCPEFECGLGVPREPMHLEGAPDAPRLVTNNTQQDHTKQLLTWARRRLVELEGENLCGFVFKRNSPSCGVQRVEVYNEKGIPVKEGVGIFARLFMEHFPMLPVEDEGRLQDAKVREDFIEKCRRSAL